jgi:23S rRNA (guanosine2251-2'-O)-methyltransferase
MSRPSRPTRTGAQRTDRPRGKGRSTPAAGSKPGPSKPASVRGDDRQLFGLHAVAAAWANPARICRKLRATETALAELAPVIAEAAGTGLDRPAPETVDRAKLDRLVPGAVHQGVVLEVEPLEPVDLDDIGRAAEVTGHGLVVVLDQVTDPHNIGAILRSAAAFGASALVVTDRHAPPVTGTLAKTASGAVEHVPVVRVRNLARALEELKGWGFTVLGLAEEAETVLSDAPIGHRAALCLGAEGPGLRRLTRETCDGLVKLPTGGPIASLNVSNAAAIALYEAARRRA